MISASFLKTILFAAVAALAMPFMVLVTPPAWLPIAPLALLAGAYAMGLAPQLPKGLGLGLVATVLTLDASIWLDGWLPLALAVAVVIAILRSGLVFRVAPVRALAVESGVAAIALGLAALFYAPSYLGLALSTWGFFLGQSVYFLLSSTRRARAADSASDRFETAYRRAMRVLDEGAG